MEIIYDIDLDQEGKLVVVLYERKLVSKNGETLNTFEIIETYCPENISEEIINLKNKGYKKSVSYNPNMPFTNFSYIKNIVQFKTCKLLELLYEEVIINNVVHLALYISFINMNTGNITTNKTGSILPYSDLENLLELGYKPIYESAFYKKSIELNR